MWDNEVNKELSCIQNGMSETGKAKMDKRKFWTLARSCPLFWDREEAGRQIL